MLWRRRYLLHRSYDFTATNTLHHDMCPPQHIKVNHIQFNRIISFEWMQLIFLNWNANLIACNCTIVQGHGPRNDEVTEMKSSSIESAFVSHRLRSIVFYSIYYGVASASKRDSQDIVRARNHSDAFCWFRLSFMPLILWYFLHSNSMSIVSVLHLMMPYVNGHSTRNYDRCTQWLRFQ